MDYLLGIYHKQEKIFIMGCSAKNLQARLVHYKILHSCEITPKTGGGACVHSEIRCDIEQKSYLEVRLIPRNQTYS